MLPTGVTRGRPNPRHWGFVRRLRKTRLAADLHLAGLSEAAGLGKTLVGRLERGSGGVPTLSTVERLADVLRVSAGWLAYGIESPWEPATELRCQGLAARLRQVRAEQELSLQELGRRAGSSAAAVRTLEAETLPSIATLEEIAKAIGVSPAWLAFGTGEREMPKRGSRPVASQRIDQPDR